jgi:hypothetical protein
MPTVVEADTTVPLPATRNLRLRVRITLSAGGLQSTRGVDVPADIPVPALRIPTLLALFVHRNFAPSEGGTVGGVLLVVPTTSTLHAVGAVLPAVDALRQTVGALTGFGVFASLLPVLETLRQAVAAAQNQRLEARTSIRELRDIVIVPGGLLSIGTISGADEISSLAFVGPPFVDPGATPRSRVQCFNAPGASIAPAVTPSGEGQLDVTLPASMGVLIPDLHSAAPASSPAGSATVVAPPAGFKIPGGFITTFGDEFSSLRFA